MSLKFSSDKNMKTENVTLKNKEKIILLGNFATMLKSGITLAEAIDSLLEDAKGNLKIVLESMRNDITQGKRVYIAFSRFPKTFDKVTVGVIKASEEAGKLHIALRDLKDNLKKQNAFMNKVMLTLLYPIVVIFIFIAMFVMILTFVIPRFSQVFKQLNVKLPLPTKILFAMSASVTSHMLIYIIGIIVMILLLIYLYTKYKHKLIRWISSFPLIRNLVIYIDLTRFFYNFHILLESGINIVSSLDLLKDIVFNKHVSQVIENATKTVSAGKKLSVGLKTDKKIVPTLMIKLVEAGEATGTLHQSLKDVSEYLDNEVVNSLQVLTALLEPIILVVIGVTIGGMLMAIIAPIYQIIGQISPH